jgi:hypothetical protein
MIRKIITKPLTITLLILVITIGIPVCIIKIFTHKVTYEGVVINHNITSDRFGNIVYYTVAKFNDGNLRSLNGLGYYVKPIGSTIYYTIREFK